MKKIGYIYRIRFFLTSKRWGKKGLKKETTLHNPSQTDIRTLKPISEKNFKFTFHCPSAIASSPSSLRVAVPFHPLSFNAALFFFPIFDGPCAVSFSCSPVLAPHIVRRGTFETFLCILMPFSRIASTSHNTVMPN